MCYIWQNPTLPEKEVTLATLDKIPDGVDYLNLTGGEPTLRQDLLDIVDLLYPKAMQLEISSNGLNSHRIEPIINKYPDVKIRYSLEGSETTNNRIRGEDDGYNKKVAGLLRLQELGGTDLGFAITIQDDNVQDLVYLFQLCQKHGFELATSTLHNGFQFHKSDNVLYDRLKVAHHIEGLITEQLKTYDVKNWFRAYLNLGLISKALGLPRLLRCTAATDFVFIDPWSDVYACNVRPDLRMGNLEGGSWDEIYNGPLAQEITQKVYQCKHNCWMVGSAKTAMRNSRFSKLPKADPTLWVIINKLRVMLNQPILFEKYIDYSQVHLDDKVSKRQYFFGKTFKRQVESRDHHYTDDYFNV